MTNATTIKEMFKNLDFIKVPSYQRSYSWDSKSEEDQIQIFLKDLDNYIKRKDLTSDSPYYLGHFLFEKKQENDSEKFYVIDGQQRLTTIVICLASLFGKIRSLRPSEELNEEELELYELFIKKGQAIKFSTVEYDINFFKGKVIDGDINSTMQEKFETQSSRRILEAFCFFNKAFKDKTEKDLFNILKAITEATCTSYKVADQSQAIQIFIFQNNRGKPLSKLEILKARFMHTVFLLTSTVGERTDLIKRLEESFKSIYKHASILETYAVRENTVLSTAFRVYFKHLKVDEDHKTENSLNIEKESSEKVLIFIEGFMRVLEDSFEKLKNFYIDQENYFFMHSLRVLISMRETSSLWYAFIVKAYEFNLGAVKINELCRHFESIALRESLNSGRAKLVPRIQYAYEEFLFQKNPQPIITCIENLKIKTDYWWGHWNNENFRKNLEAPNMTRVKARYILWKYEIFLGKPQEEGYNTERFDKLKNLTEEPSLEHIAPQTEPDKPTGYAEYDDEFKWEYLDSLGNYMLISQPHNASLSNSPFPKKLERYNILNQQREIKDFFKDKRNLVWGKEEIEKRRKKIVDAILEIL